MSRRAPTLTYDLAWRTGMDAGNRAMRKGGRKVWSEADYNISAREMNRLLDAICKDDPRHGFCVPDDRKNPRRRRQARRNFDAKDAARMSKAERATTEAAQKERSRGPFYVVPWSGAESGWYHTKDVVRIFKREHAAGQFARKRNDETGTNLVVRTRGAMRD